MAVRTTFPCHAMSRGNPTLSETNRAIQQHYFRKHTIDRRPHQYNSRRVLIPGGGKRNMKTAILALLFGATAATAQTYPSKPIRIIIAQAPGSASDVISRTVANKMQEGLGQPVVVEPKPGAGGALG